MCVKVKLEKLNDEIISLNNKELISKVSEIKGLYSAYELSSNTAILQKVVDGLIDAVKLTLTLPINNTQKAIMNKANRYGELAGFYSFLIEQGKKPTTADNYRKAIKQVVEVQGLGGLGELETRLIEMINLYDGNDRAAHNAHTAALKQYSKYLKNLDA